MHAGRVDEQVGAELVDGAVAWMRLGDQRFEMSVGEWIMNVRVALPTPRSGNFSSA
jgi:hypothetical protein